jgi:hypothetical protein
VCGKGGNSVIVALACESCRCPREEVRMEMKVSHVIIYRIGGVKLRLKGKMGAVMDVNAFGGDVYDIKIVDGACIPFGNVFKRTFVFYLIYG